MNPTDPVGWGMVPVGQDRWIARPVIRLAGPADLPVLRDLYRRSSLSNEGDVSLLVTRPELLDLTDAAVREGRTRVAVVGRGLVGFSSTVVRDDAVELEDLFVDPDRMREGIGRALIEDLVDRARRGGRSRIVVDANEHALAFYREVGFVGLGEVPPEHGTAIRMRLDIRS